MRREYEYHMTSEHMFDLWEFLKHGDEDHQMWLLDALEAWRMGWERPPER